MMEMQIKLALGNAAFDPTPEYEVARILRHLAQQLEDGRALEDLGSIRDVNGNVVGCVSVFEGN